MPTYLADKSALARMRHPAVAARLEPLITLGEVATCGLVELEVLWSARGWRELAETRRERAIAFPYLPMAEDDLGRAITVMAELARRRLHRTASIPDLLIAAVAERSGLTVLHYGRDFDRIATVTGQRVEWIVPSGTVP